MGLLLSRPRGWAGIDIKRESRFLGGGRYPRHPPPDHKGSEPGYRGGTQDPQRPFWRFGPNNFGDFDSFFAQYPKMPFGWISYAVFYCV